MQQEYEYAKQGRYSFIIIEGVIQRHRMTQIFTIFVLISRKIGKILEIWGGGDRPLCPPSSTGPVDNQPNY